MWIDAHCHLSDPRIQGRIDEIIRSSREAGIGHFLLGGVGPDEWERQKLLALAHPGSVFPVFGLHPWWVDGLLDDDSGEGPRGRLSQALKALQEQAGGAWAIGETGLDGARGRLKRSQELQLLAFREQLRLAVERDQPAVLHVVRAHPLALQLLEEAAFSRARGLIHSFSGTWQDARRYLERGWLISFSARLLHPDAHGLRTIVRECPADRLVFETDSPDQPPVGHGGALHTPVSLLKVVGKASEIRNETLETLMARSRDNLARVFRLPL